MPGEAPRGNAGARAHATLRDAILRGEIPLGTMLSENELATRLGMSRTPVRTALARLQDEGWVEIYPQRGALVREPGATEVREYAEVRNALESAGVRLGAGDRGEQVLDRLAADVDAQVAALAAGDLLSFATSAMRFHRGFVEIAGNQAMLAAYDRLQDRQLMSIVRSSSRLAGDRQGVLEDHRTLLADARRGDWVAFTTHLDEHQTRSHAVETGLG